MARRGRNNRLMMRSIQKNIFDEALDEDFNSPLVTLKGQKHYLEKYNKAWLGKRARVHEQSALGRKRVKFSNFEICMESHPHL